MFGEKLVSPKNRSKIMSGTMQCTLYSAWNNLEISMASQ